MPNMLISLLFTSIAILVAAACFKGFSPDPQPYFFYYSQKPFSHMYFFQFLHAFIKTTDNGLLDGLHLDTTSDC